MKYPIVNVRHPALGDVYGTGRAPVPTGYDEIIPEDNVTTFGDLEEGDYFLQSSGPAKDQGLWKVGKRTPSDVEGWDWVSLEMIWSIEALPKPGQPVGRAYSGDTIQFDGWKNKIYRKPFNFFDWLYSLFE